MDELLQLLDDAVAVYSEMHRFWRFDTEAEFAAELGSLRERIAQQDWSAIEALVSIFAPTSTWDDSVGVPGMHIANRIMAALEKLQKRPEM
ncbi:hypothetical protein [Trichothermofontia sp.]